MVCRGFWGGKSLEGVCSPNMQGISQHVVPRTCSVSTEMCHSQPLRRLNYVPARGQGIDLSEEVVPVAIQREVQRGGRDEIAPCSSARQLDNQPSSDDFRPGHACTRLEHSQAMLPWAILPSPSAPLSHRCPAAMPSSGAATDWPWSRSMATKTPGR